MTLSLLGCTCNVFDEEFLQKNSTKEAMPSEEQFYRKSSGNETCLSVDLFRYLKTKRRIQKKNIIFSKYSVGTKISHSEYVW